ncbi:MAG: hypothetical protein WC707_06200 [Candidatus Babeliaceae bacterium]|jgi:diadenosine tetraphosphate (Ap4A) HIT family hydrolase
MNQNLIHQKGCIFCEAKFNKILLSTENFIIALDDFPLTEGHLLIFSKEHHGCGGELPKKNLIDLIDLKNKVSSLLQQIYGKVSFYEHGRAGHCVSFGPDEIMCHHFHLHALPISCDISITLDTEFQRCDIPSYQTIDDFFYKFGEYLFFENSQNKGAFYPVVNKIQSHLLRTMIAESLKAPERADWEHFDDKIFISTALEQAQTKIKFT